MPELAEVEFYRKRWHQAAVGERVVRLLTHDTKKLLRELDLPAFRRALIGATFEFSEAAAKQMLFRFSGDVWLGIHLGMSGELTVASPDHAAGKHDHLVIVTDHHALVFNDPRMFGSVDFHVGKEPPKWWQRIAPPILSNKFTIGAVAEFLQDRKSTRLNSVTVKSRMPSSA